MLWIKSPSNRAIVLSHNRPTLPWTPLGIQACTSWTEITIDGESTRGRRFIQWRFVRGAKLLATAKMRILLNQWLSGGAFYIDTEQWNLNKKRAFLDNYYTFNFWLIGWIISFFIHLCYREMQTAIRIRWEQSNRHLRLSVFLFIYRCPMVMSDCRHLLHVGGQRPCYELMYRVSSNEFMAALTALSNVGDVTVLHGWAQHALLLSPRTARLIREYHLGQIDADGICCVTNKFRTVSAWPR